MEQSTFADSRPRQVHDTLAIDIQDVAAVSMVDDNWVADTSCVVFRTGLVLNISPGAAKVLIEMLKAKDDRRRVWQVDTSLPMDLDAAPELRNWGRRAYYETGLADNDWRLLYSDEQS